ncbi:GIY-YIG nuclease family protein [Croceitalea rosinachiae]|uniref:GIY-YIG nuclease family protein n=1 Tax=Croceitalea rosinachiae TaxID=3075596 RepID=A0ABU3A891_9FLAO|nr:GIY-YIG nuclease family protein [Croceitalea sp. F388]MDT0606090.1 GIY-YIG nuclease family protein [Croceitalea sp. F388]
MAEEFAEVLEAFEATMLYLSKRLCHRSMKGYTYILECADGSYYTGSTKDLELRLTQHQNGEGANHTKKRLPVELVYVELFQRIDEAFYREKQIQGWSRKKKEALIAGNQNKLPELSIAYRDRK